MPVITLPRAPLTRPIVAGDPNSAPVKSVPWREWFDHLKVVVDTIGGTSGGGGSGGAGIIEGTHATRLASYPAAANPETIYIETDRNRVMYISDGVNWNYHGGTILTSLAGMLAIAAALGSHDAGLLFYSSTFDRTYRWSGAAIGEINARDRSIHMCAEAPETAGYALCDGSTVTRSRPDGTTYSWVTPNLSGRYPKFADAYTGSGVAASAPTLHVTAKIPAGTLTHHHDYDGSTGNAVDNDNAPWEHRHYIDEPSATDTTAAHDGDTGDGSTPWEISGTFGGDAEVGGSLTLPNHQHQFPAHTPTGGAKNGDETDWSVTGTVGGATDFADAPLSGSVSTGISGTLGSITSACDEAVHWEIEFTGVSPTDVAACSHTHDIFASLNDGTVFFGSSSHQHSITDAAFSDTSNDHVHPLDELESGPVVGSVGIDISSLTVTLTDVTFGDVNLHHHAIDLTGSSTGDATDMSGEAAAPHHHNYEGTTDDSIQGSDFFCTMTETADADAEMSHMALMGYISL